MTGRVDPSASSTSPLTRTTLRRNALTGVDSVRCANEMNKHAVAASQPGSRMASSCANVAVSAGSAPHSTANHRSEWNAPPNSSRLYAITPNVPAATNASSHHDTSTAPTTPMATAPTSPTTAMAPSTRWGILVWRGRPASSSSACAVSPTARKNASTVAPSRPPSKFVATHAPIAT